MAQEDRRSLGEGILAGVIAGALFAMMEIVGAALMGNPPLMPIRMFASVVLGQNAMEGPLGTAIIVGLIAHFALSGAFGVVYAFLNRRLPAESRERFGRQTGIGIVFGIAVWLVNFHVIARILYPWFLMTPQFLQAMMHALFFGLPLALVYAAAERHTHAPAPAPRAA